MNERIRQLHQLARDHYLQDEYLDLPAWEVHDRISAKFAELIVRECVQMFAENGYDESCDMLIEHWDIDPRTFRS